jgi:hypothetical protein
MVTWLDGTSTARPDGYLEYFFNVAAYGAVGNGVTDDSVAIQAALTAAGTAGGGVVWVPENTYICNGLTIPSNVKLRGCGWGSILKQPSGVADNTYLLSAFGTGTGTTTNKLNIGISDLQLLGRSDTDTFTQYVHLVELSGCSDVVIERCLFQNFRGDGICIASNLNGGTAAERHNERITVRDCRFQGGAAKNNRNGISIIDGTDVLIEACAFETCTASGMPGAIDIEPNANAYHRIRHIAIRNCSFVDVGGNAGVISYYNIMSQASLTVPSSGIQITGCSIRNCTNSIGGFFAQQSQTPTTATERTDFLFADNHVEGPDWQPFEIGGIRGIRIERNLFTNNIADCSIGFSFKAMDVILKNNDFYKSGSASGRVLAIMNADRMRIEDNVFDTNGDGATAGDVVRFQIGTGSVGASSEIDFVRNRLVGYASAISTKAAAHTLSVDTNQYYDNDFSTFAPDLTHWTTNDRILGAPVATVTYSASMTPDAALSSYQKITPTNTTAMTINAPTNPATGLWLTLDFLNSSGGTMGVVTFNAAFKLAGAFTNPASTKRRTITFRYDGTSWVEMARAAADI